MTALCLKSKQKLFDRMSIDLPSNRTEKLTIKWSGGGAMVWRGCFGPLEIIDTSSVDQETYINILANSFRSWFTNVTVHQERYSIFQEDGASCHTGDYAR
ncbi:hypothetical protein RO3G_14123 [Rhizopus delemar RA 99-880]|uniref:Tc1-like transposase DDE domain-containing protein n=1 Tax=Rhizopus delemar (strain RA 99-880 / ATCC MYA-4621 / FGSC 9543 / NRRL 43880) TaxID=246409 RepID=I1CLT2_RHIO9|nr:hypothetical protein RO3G_14123 [Rhizopus delemar RA 99-880]|eukprot:EIE89412.1 hypothetical protein RO3G_14123 [Rhizopus delemar RA 99-880]